MISCKLSSFDDEQLACRARAGELACFEELVRRYQAPLMRFLQRRGTRRQEAEDVLQEAFLKAYQSLGAYRENRPFRTWMFTLAYRLAVSAARRKQPDGADMDRAAAVEDSPSLRMEREEAGRNIWDTARRLLGDEQFRALWLHYGESMPARDVARVLGRSWVWVKTTLHRARRALLEHWEAKAATAWRDNVSPKIAPCLARGET